MVNEHIVLHPALCAGALAVSDPETPAWARATGVLVLSFRHFMIGAQLLGASRELANDLLPYALAAHARMVRLFPEYLDRRCRLPLWTLPLTP